MLRVVDCCRGRGPGLLKGFQLDSIVALLQKSMEHLDVMRSQGQKKRSEWKVALKDGFGERQLDSQQRVEWHRSVRIQAVTWLSAGQ